MNDQETKNRVILIITLTLCAFLMISLIGVYTLAWANKPSEDIWPKIFDLISVLSGALVGYIAGTQVEKTRIQNQENEYDIDVSDDFDSTADDDDDESV
jgi:pilus assembly protein TadC